jgi:RimJ/RimL family protein N-acetyltransferase
VFATGEHALDGAESSEKRNAIGIALYEKFGFEVEGTHRRFAFRDGEYVDAYSMARLKP